MDAATGARNRVCPSYEIVMYGRIGNRVRRSDTLQWAKMRWSHALVDVA